MLTSSLKLRGLPFEPSQFVSHAGLVSSFDFVLDRDYILSFSNKYFTKLLSDLKNAQTEAAIAEATRSVLKVPPILREHLDSVDVVRAQFNELRRRRNGEGS